MAYPRWLAKLNKRVFNPLEVRRGKRPLLIHKGRVSGTEYSTPMDAHPTRDGYVLVVRYGPRSDWVRNALAAGTVTLRMEGEEHSLTAPRLISEAEALAALPDGYDPGRDFSKAEDFLLLDREG
jgi:deazaflavin-dependent oxidoreductase (nitroreductase family)